MDPGKIIRSDATTHLGPASAASDKQQSTFRLVITCAVIIFVLIFGFATQLVPFGFAVIRCRHLPIVATNFAAAFSYKVPGDQGYGPNFLSMHYFCTEQQAHDAGYNRAAI